MIDPSVQAGLTPAEEQALLKKRHELQRQDRLLALGAPGVAQVRQELREQIRQLDFLLLRVPRERDTAPRALFRDINRKDAEGQ